MTDIHAAKLPDELPVIKQLFQEYAASLNFDLDFQDFRDELETLPWREALYGAGVAVIEWPERLGPYLPEERFDIQLKITGEESRIIKIAASGKTLYERLDAWSSQFVSILDDAGCRRRRGRG